MTSQGHKQFCLFFIIAATVSAIDYNLTLMLQKTLVMDPGFQIMQTDTVNLFLYCTAANSTHFQVIKYDLNTFLKLDESSFFPAYLDLSFTGGSLNPNFYTTQYSILVVYKKDISLGGVSAQFCQTNLQSYTSTQLPLYFIGVYIPTSAAFYYKNQIGDEGLLNNFATVNQMQDFHHSYPLINPNPASFQVIMSWDHSHIVTLDKSANFITKCALTYNGSLITGISRVQYAITSGGILAACFNPTGVFYIHSADYYIRYFTPTFSYKVDIYVGQQLGQACYYDSLTQSLLFLMAAIGTPKITINQYQLKTLTLTKPIALANTNIAFSGQHALHLSRMNSLSIFNTVSCGNNYDASNYSCLGCQLNCAACSTDFYCTTCSLPYTTQILKAYLGVVINQCQLTPIMTCPLNCASCLNSTLCTLCSINYLLGTDGQCNTNQSTIAVFVKKLMNYIMENTTINKINSFPSSRAILRPILSYFTSFDDLYPYMYHERDYGSFMQNIFATIYQMEMQKWNTYDEHILDPLLNKFDTNQANFTKSSDTYYNYSSPTFLMWVGNGQTVHISILSFATSNFAISCTLFVVFFILFKLLFRFKVSVYLRSYSFFSYFIFFIMEGNLQMLTFYACSVLKLNFYRNVGQQLQTAIAYFILFFIVIFAVGGYLTVYFSFKKLAKYFSDNVNISFETILFLTIDLGLKNFLLGLVHSLFRKASLYGVQFSCLAAIELMCLVNYVYFLRLNKMFEFKLKIWLRFWLSLLRLCFIFLLFVKIFFYAQISDASSLQQLTSFLISVYIFATILGTLLNIVYILANVLYINIFQKCSFSKVGQDKVTKLMIPKLNCLQEEKQINKIAERKQIQYYVIQGKDNNKCRNKVIIKCASKGKHLICKNLLSPN